ncbi:MAG: TRAP transporter substrate-binding protein [Xanthobacteraceae bacterium]
MSMTRRSVLKAGTALVAGAYFTGPSQAAEFRYRLGLELRENEPLPVRMIAACKAIAEETGGRMQITGFPNGALGSPVETLNQVRTGAIEFLTSSFGILSTVERRAGLPTLGFIFDGYDKIWPAIDGDLGKYVKGVVEKRGELFMFDSVHDIGFRHVTSNRGFFIKPESIRSLRIRTPPSPFLTSLFKALGASPTPLAFGDLYSALQTGTVDAQENPLELVASFKFYEVQKFCTLTGHTWDGWVPVANKRAWERLPEDIRDVVARNFKKAAIEQRKDVFIQHKETRKLLEAKGMTFETPEAGIYRKTLQGTDFYSSWKSQIGDEGWAAIESVVGPIG